MGEQMIALPRRRALRSIPLDRSDGVLARIRLFSIVFF